jgi:virulence-associated protein VapD
MKEKQNEQNPPSFFERLFRCCIEEQDKESELLKSDKNSTFNKSNLIFENESSLFPIITILPEEKNKITFTKEGLIKYIKDLQNLVFPVICQQDNVKISKRNYSDINDKLPIYRFEIVKHKLYFTDVPKIQQLVNALTVPEQRKKWDSNIKEYKIMDKIKENSEIIRIITNKQLSVIAEKEFYEKRIGIMEDNVYYLFSSSIPDSNYVDHPNFGRAKNVMSITVIKEDEDNFYFDCFNQIDANIKLPEEFIESNLLNKINNFFNKYFEYLNKLE